MKCNKKVNMKLKKNGLRGFTPRQWPKDDTTHKKNLNPFQRYWSNTFIFIFTIKSDYNISRTEGFLYVESFQISLQFKSELY